MFSRHKRALFSLPLVLLAVTILAPGSVHTVSGQSVGRVCLSPISSPQCPASPVSVSSPVETQMSVYVIVQGADSIGGFDITLVANHTIIKPADASLAGSILSGGTVLAKRIGGVLKTGSACRPSDSLDTIELAAIDPPGQVTYAPTTGLLFTAVYNVTGTIGTPIDFQTGCSQSSVNGTSICVQFENGITSPPLVTVQGASYTATPMPTFTIGSSQAEVTVIKGTSANSTITLISLDGFSGNVAFTVFATPSVKHPPALVVSPNSVSLTSNGFNTALFVVSASSNTTRSVYTITITAVGGGVSGSLQLQLFIFS